jgi:hypothetical protein
MRLSAAASRAGSSAGIAGEEIGQKAVEFAAAKGPVAIRHRVRRVLRWSRDHPAVVIAGIFIGRALIGVFTAALAKSADAR